jgi:hypothetical protein
MAVADMGDALGTVSSAYFWEARPEEVHRKTGDFGWQIGWKIGQTLGRWNNGRKF